MFLNKICEIIKKMIKRIARVFKKFFYKKKRKPRPQTDNTEIIFSQDAVAVDVMNRFVEKIDKRKTVNKMLNVNVGRQNTVVNEILEVFGISRTLDLKTIVMLNTEPEKIPPITAMKTEKNIDLKTKTVDSQMLCYCTIKAAGISCTLYTDKTVDVMDSSGKQIAWQINQFLYTDRRTDQKLIGMYNRKFRQKEIIVFARAYDKPYDMTYCSQVTYECKLSKFTRKSIVRQNSLISTIVEAEDGVILHGAYALCESMPFIVVRVYKCLGETHALLVLSGIAEWQEDITIQPYNDK